MNRYNRELRMFFNLHEPVLSAYELAEIYPIESVIPLEFAATRAAPFTVPKDVPADVIDGASIRMRWLVSPMGLACFVFCVGFWNLNWCTERYGWKDTGGFDPVRSTEDRPRYKNADFERMQSALFDRVAISDAVDSDTNYLVDEVLMAMGAAPIMEKFIKEFGFLMKGLIRFKEVPWSEQSDTKTETPSSWSFWESADTGRAGLTRSDVEPHSADEAMEMTLKEYQSKTKSDRKIPLPLEELYDQVTSPSAVSGTALNILPPGAIPKKSTTAAISKPMMSPEEVLLDLDIMLDADGPFWRLYRILNTLALERTHPSKAGELTRRWYNRLRRGSGTLTVTGVPEQEKHSAIFTQLWDLVIGKLTCPDASQLSRNFLLYGPPGGGKTTMVEL